jgi:outer membrane protein OmpA-like peptidoglycan-associated protein
MSLFALATPLLLALGPAAQAQSVDVPDLDAQLFRPSLDSRYTLWTNDSTRQANHTIMGRAIAHYTKDPLVFFPSEDADGVRVISDIVQTDFAAGYQLGFARIGLTMPLYLFADGNGSPSQAGFGDLALDLKATLLERTPDRVGIAVLGRVGLPTGNLDGLRATLPTGEIEGIVDRDLGKRAFIAANLGFRILPDAGLRNWSDTLYGRLGFGLKTSEQAGLSAELIGHGITPDGVPSEVLLGGWGRAAKGLHMRGGVGTALGRGIGTPQLRAMFGLAFEPTFEPDRDGDGITDFDDSCRDKPEDLDGVADEDGCPEPTKVTVVLLDADGEPFAKPEAKEGEEADEDAPTATFTVGTQKGVSGDTIELMGGIHSVSAEMEGYEWTVKSIDVRDQEAQEVRIQLESSNQPGSLVVKAVGLDGKPVDGAIWFEKATKHRSIPANEETPLLPGDYEIVVNAPGFRRAIANVTIEKKTAAALEVQLKPARVKLTAKRIEIQESIFFELGKATIKEESFGLLSEVANVLLNHPELTKIRIEGHTDDQGPAAQNKTLSQARADAVRDFLVEKGVEAARLETEGFGEEKPLEKGTSEEARAKNRRVDFFVAERAEPAKQPAPDVDDDEEGEDAP